MCIKQYINVDKHELSIKETNIFIHLKSSYVYFWCYLVLSIKYFFPESKTNNFDTIAITHKNNFYKLSIEPFGNMADNCWFHAGI